MRILPAIWLSVLLVVVSCSTSEKSAVAESSTDSANSVQQADSTGTPAYSAISPIAIDIIEIFTEGTYFDAELPGDGNWYALVAKDGGLAWIVKVELNESRYEPSAGEDVAPTIDISTIPETDPVILFRVAGKVDEREIPGDLENKFIAPAKWYELNVGGFTLLGEGMINGQYPEATETSVENTDVEEEPSDESSNSYENYGLMLQWGDHAQQLYSGLTFGGENRPTLIWYGDINADNIPDLLFNVATNPSEVEAQYELWISDASGGDNLVKIVAVHKVYEKA